MIGYKATYNGKCFNYKLYEVDQTYTLDGQLVICENGFHFCQDLYDVFSYYATNKDLKIFKVEALGNIDTEGDKSVTDKIKILEEVDLSNMVLEKYGSKKYFNNKGNYIKIENSDGSWAKREYDKNNNLIKEETSSGSWEKWKYDENNNCIKFENSYGFCFVYEYDKYNNLIKNDV